MKEQNFKSITNLSQHFIQDSNIKKINKYTYAILNKNNNKKNKFYINKAIVPFGLEKYGYGNKTNYYLKLNVSRELSTIIQNIEYELFNYINDTYEYNLDIQSQVIIKNLHPDQLVVKIKKQYNKLCCDIVSNNNLLTLYDLKKGEKINCCITPNIYISDTKFILKWTISSIEILR